MSKTGKLTFALFFILLTFGMVVLSSAGIVDAQKKFGDSNYYLVHQLLYGVIPGIIIMLVFYYIPTQRWRSWSIYILIVALIMMVSVFIPGIGIGIKGAQRWINLGFITVQPAEFLKFALVIYLAAWFAGSKGEARAKVSLLPFLLVLGFTAFLLAIQPDFGTLGIVIMIGIAIYFFSGAKISHLMGLMATFVILITVMSFLAPYRFDRIKTFINPHEDKQGSSYHLNQSLIAIGSGGILGVGYGQSKQKEGFLPEPVGDSIFAIMIEEFGLLGGVTFIALLVVFLFLLFLVGLQNHDMFSRLIVFGVAVWIGGQSFVNMAAITGLIPLTGIPLPLMSYGSSSMVSIMGAMGVVWRISKVT